MTRSLTKICILLVLLFIVHTAHTQVKDGNKTRQIEQLQQLRQTISRKIDTLNFRLSEQSDSIENINRKLEQLKEENSNKDKSNIILKEQPSKLSADLAVMANLAGSLQKKFDLHLLALDKAINFQKDLQDKINILVRENNR